jgi:hypothetical protein
MIAIKPVGKDMSGHIAEHGLTQYFIMIGDDQIQMVGRGTPIQGLRVQSGARIPKFGRNACQRTIGAGEGGKPITINF